MVSIPQRSENPFALFISSANIIDESPSIPAGLVLQNLNVKARSMLLS
jgi:hypothetical protein